MAPAFQIHLRVVGVVPENGIESHISSGQATHRYRSQGLRIPGIEESLLNQRRAALFQSCRYAPCGS